MEPSRITIRLPKSLSSRSRVEVATAMVTLKSTYSVPDRAPDLESPVVVEQPAPAQPQGRRRGVALSPVSVRAQPVVLVEDHVAAVVQHVGEVVDLVPVGD